MTARDVLLAAADRIATDYAAFRADVRERFTFAAVAPSRASSPRSPARCDGGTFSTGDDYAHQAS